MYFNVLGSDYIKVLCRLYKPVLLDFCSKSQIFSNIVLNLIVMTCLGEFRVDPSCRTAPAVSDVTLSMETEIEFEVDFSFTIRTEGAQSQLSH